jgi:hypothetical protein
MKIVIFGASVSEQTIKHDDKSITGYINYLEKNIKLLKLNYDIHRITAGSCSIHDAGIALVDDVVSLNPDICILDWCSAGETNCSYEIITSIYNKLTSKNILPINLVLPRKDRDQNQTNLYKYTKEISNKYSLPFWDLSEKINKGLLESILRDNVHTNHIGAQFYSEFVIHQLLHLELQPIPVVESKIILNRKLHEFNNNINKTRNIKIELSTENSFINNQIYVFLEQRIGPWSRELKCNLLTTKNTSKELDNVILHDPWSWRERQCIKPLAPFVQIEDDTNSITFSISTDSNDMTCIKHGLNKVDYSSFPSEIRPKGRLIILCDNQQYFIKRVYVK